MKQLFDNVSARCSKLVTLTYSTSFSMGIYCFNKQFRAPIYGIYGFVRFADEIVDSFHGYDKKHLLEDFRRQTYDAITHRISLNPILNSFQEVVNAYGIDLELIDAFLNSMEMDLLQTAHDKNSFEAYVYGSAEVVGLMCLKVFTNGNNHLYNDLTGPARKLGSVFQKINFLRDLKADYSVLGRTYFYGIDMSNFSDADKNKIEADIENEFKDAYKGIMQLPKETRLGVYVAYMYYYKLFQKIKSVSSRNLIKQRIRVANNDKLLLMLRSYLKFNLNLL